MNYADLLSSGLLELYVAGACTDEERAAVERAMSSDARVQAEISRISNAVELLAKQQAVAPPKHLRSTIISSIEESSTQTSKPVSAPAAYRLPLLPSLPFLRAASIGFIIGVLPTAYFLYERTQLSDKLNTAESELLAQRQATSVIAQKASRLEQTIDGVVNQNVQRVQLSAVVATDVASATIFWNKATRAVLIDARSLPSLTSEQDYQLWAIVGGTPVSLGVLDKAPSVVSLQNMTSVENPAMFAITVEPKGGSVAPTLTAMKVAGKVI